MFAIPKRGFALTAAAALLAGCGGGDDHTPSPPAAVTAQVSASASVSVDGFISYLQALISSSADTLQPVDVSAFTAPTSETAAPTPLN